jgi:DNA-binding GntR family transcriptional regulator
VPTPDAAPTVSDSEIYERMVSAILDHKLLPGTKLVEDKIASAFGVSRTRVRPVLVRLASEQIVTLTPNRGASVAQPTEQEAREVFEVRRLIEPTLVQRFIAVAQPADIQRLADCIAAEETAREAGDMRRAIRQAGDFHLHIAQAAGHQTLGRVLRELVSRTSLVLMTFSSHHAMEREEATACGCREHGVLLDAIRLRDAREASRSMRKHLDLLEARLEFTPPAEEPIDLAAVLAAA